MDQRLSNEDWLRAWIAGDAKEMKLEITDVIERAMARRWSENQEATALAGVARCNEQAETDWDAGAGENWGRILRGGEVVGYVGMRWPLALLVADRALATIPAMEDVEVIAVPAMDACCLSAQAGAMRRFTGGRLSDAIDLNGFSPEDFVWMSI